MTEAISMKLALRVFLPLLTLTIIPASTFARPRQSTDAARVTGPAPSAGPASVPRLVQINAILKDASARPVAGVSSVAFAIYSDEEGGAALWSETQNVLADPNGHFTVLLGAATSNGVPVELFGTGQSRWLGITIARQPEMPRILLASVPYALKAADADTLGGLPASAYVTTASLAASQAALAKNANTTIVASPFAASQSAPTANAATQSVTQAAVTGTGTTNYIPVWNSGSNLVNSKIFQGTNGYIGINTITPQLQLDVTGNSIFRGSVQLPPQGIATASTGQPSRSFQWEASVFNGETGKAQNEAFGFRSVPAQGTNNTGAPAAQFDLFYGPGGGTLTDTGLSIDNTGVISFAQGQVLNALASNVQQASVAELDIPTTSSATQGVILMDGSPFISAAGTTTNAFLGVSAGGSTFTQGPYNTGIGSSALTSITNGSNNTALGADSLLFNTTGSWNTGLGADALFDSVSGTSNTAIGYTALSATTANDNTAIGAKSGATNTSGSNNTFLGYAADASSATFSNATAIGANAKVGASNAMVLGGTGVNAVAVGIGVAIPMYTLHVIDQGFNGTAIGAFSSIPGDAAVVGTSTATTGTSYGGYFRSESASGDAVVGVNQAGGTAGEFIGNVNITGTLTKGGGSFKIDDPIDPANKFLSHSFVESPDMMNIYNGIVTLDAHGSAVVSMPDWFDALNRDFRYQLTAIGSPAPKLYIAEKMRGNQFRIAGGKKGQEVSWMVTGIRHDAWANAHRIPNEEEKPANEQGKYLHPELYGAGPQQAIAADPAHTAGSAAADSANAAALPPASPAAANVAGHSTGGEK
jgi:trimeric autotransporter adhesin